MTTLKVETVGKYWKLANKTVDPDRSPNRLNKQILNLQEDIDLNFASEHFVDEGAGDGFDSFFDYLRKTHKRGTPLREAVGADFVSNRRIIQQFAMAPYRTIDIDIQAYRYKDIIFMNIKDQPEDLNYDFNQRCAFKFEQYATLDENGEPHDRNQQPSNAECGKAVLRSTLTSEGKTIKALYSAEIDAIDSDGNFVEIKTCRVDYNTWIRSQSLPHYWQSHLGNVHSILYGYLPDFHVKKVVKVEQMLTSSIPGKQRFWKPETCKKTLFAILETIKTKLEINEDALLIRIKYRCGIEGIVYEPELRENIAFLQNIESLDHFD